jgi:transcriptional regulator with XRE-family HTH domain
MNQIYFEAKGEALLERIGMSKSEFARRMGIRKQNVKVLFKSKNLETIYKAAGIMGVPFEMLVGYVEEPDLSEAPLVTPEAEGEITATDIPTGDTVEERRSRQKIILSFYHGWKQKNPESKRFNLCLKDDINIRYVSIEETAGQASINYLSTLAVLQLDAILTNAVLVETTPANPRKKNQKGFKSMLRMHYQCPGIGVVKMMVGVKHSDKSKVQYCITAIDADKTKQEAR